MLIISTLQEDHALFLTLFLFLSLYVVATRGARKPEPPEELIIILIIQYYNE